MIVINCREVKNLLENISKKDKRKLKNKN